MEGTNTDSLTGATVLGNERAGVTAAAEQAQLAHDAELVADGNDLAALGARRPPRHDLLQRRRTVAAALTTPLKFLSWDLFFPSPT